MGITATRYHDISMGHRVYKHKSKCAHLHGHNYRIWFAAELIDGSESKDMVIDFSLIKEILCEWLEKYWDHRFLVFNDDPWLEPLQQLDYRVQGVPFNPTAENMAEYLGVEVCPVLLREHKYEHVRIVKIVVEETRKCSATWTNPRT